MSRYKQKIKIVTRKDITAIMIPAIYGFFRWITLFPSSSNVNSFSMYENGVFCWNLKLVWSLRSKETFWYQTQWPNRANAKGLSHIYAHQGNTTTDMHPHMDLLIYRVTNLIIYRVMSGKFKQMLF